MWFFKKKVKNQVENKNDVFYNAFADLKGKD